VLFNSTPEVHAGNLVYLHKNLQFEHWPHLTLMLCIMLKAVGARNGIVVVKAF